MSERDTGSKRRDSRRRKLTHAETIRRQQEIVRARELERLTWAEIAARVGMGEKEARESYRRYVAEIAPLLLAAPAEETETGLLRDLDEARQRLFQLATSADSDSARVGALREVNRNIKTEFEIRRALGLMPKPAELRSFAHDLVALLIQYDAAPEILDKVEYLLAEHAERSDNDGWKRESE